jgi:RNA polymerase sigma factor (sigma-70 family)
LREATPRILSALAGRYPGQFELCEDAVQDALVRAHTAGLTGEALRDPGAWLYVAARNRLIDLFRSEAARRDREDLYFSEPLRTKTGDPDEDWDRDDSLLLLFLCCHPVLSEASQVALTLRSVGGLSTGEAAGAFLVPESTMAQRITRAKQKLRESGARFGPLADNERAERLNAVRSVLYAIFTEGHLATNGEELFRTDLCAEGIRLTQLLRRLVGVDAETAALEALMLFTDARRPARVSAAGDLIPLDEQDRNLWDRTEIASAQRLLREALNSGPTGPLAIQAAIAAIHSEAPSIEATDWPQILALYVLLERIAPSPMTSLNRVVACAMVSGADAALDQLETVALSPALIGHHRVRAVRAHLLERAGRPGEAAAEFRAAAQDAVSAPAQRHLLKKAARIDSTEKRNLTDG